MKVFKTLQQEAICSFNLCANSPVIVSDSRYNKLDSTLAKSTFLKGKNELNQDAYVIPGSSIKGVFRHYFESQGDKYNSFTSLLFGNIDTDPNKGKIKFNDAYADMSTVKTTIRYNTAIDSISQAVKRNSLNSVEAVCKGNFRAGFKITNFTEYELEAILKAMLCIDTGELSFGGRASKGFGRMLVKDFVLTINYGYNKDFSANVKTFNSIDSALEEVLKRSYSKGKEFANV